MPTTLKSDSNGVQFDELDDGQLVVILNSDMDYDIGKVAQRLGDCLVLIGEPEQEVYEAPDKHPLLLRILNDGELIVVDNNV